MVAHSKDELEDPLARSAISYVLSFGKLSRSQTKPMFAMCIFKNHQFAICLIQLLQDHVKCYHIRQHNQGKNVTNYAQSIQ